MSTFQHGVFTEYVDNVPRPVRQVPSAVIGIVGTAPMYMVDAADRSLNDPQRTINDVDDEQYFGSKRSGFTIPDALDAIRDNGGGDVEVINVFDIDAHKTTATEIAYTFDGNDEIQLKRVTGIAPSQTTTAIDAEGITGTFTVTNTGGGTTYTLDTDYTYDATSGVISRVSDGAISALGSVEVTYDYADPGQVQVSDIIGGITDGDRTGLSALKDVFGLRGYKVKIIIVPGFSDNDSVATETEAIANDLEAYFILDAPVGSTRDEAISGRNGTAPVTNFDTSNRRAILAFPRVYDSQATPELQPLSQYIAGVIANTDAEFGYWWSPSNKPIIGITGLELPLTADFTDTDNDVTALNAAGLVTVFRDFGTGFRVWGNRSALYPSDTTPIQFIAVGRTLDIFHESLQRASLSYVDRPTNTNNALIDAIVETGNNFIRELVVEGGLIEGSRLYYSSAQNPASQLAAGRIVFSVVMMIPTPAEVIIYRTTLDINLLSNLGASAA